MSMPMPDVNGEIDPNRRQGTSFVTATFNGVDDGFLVSTDATKRIIIHRVWAIANVDANNKAIRVAYKAQTTTTYESSDQAIFNISVGALRNAGYGNRVFRGLVRLPDGNGLAVGVAGALAGHVTTVGVQYTTEAI